MKAGEGQGFGFLVGFGLVVSGPSLVVWQCYRWMKDGAWTPVSLITALRWAESPDRITWATFPTDWFGLYKLLEQIPLSVALVVAGFCVVGAVESAVNSRSRMPPKSTE